MKEPLMLRMGSRKDAARGRNPQMPPGHHLLEVIGVRTLRSPGGDKEYEPEPMLTMISVTVRSLQQFDPNGGEIGVPSGRAQFMLTSCPEDVLDQYKAGQRQTNPVSKDGVEKPAEFEPWFVRQADTHAAEMQAWMAACDPGVDELFDDDETSVAPAVDVEMWKGLQFFARVYEQKDKLKPDDAGEARVAILSIKHLSRSAEFFGAE